MISTAKRFLNRPFPYDTSIFNKWKIALVFGSFIAAFLIVFAPFGLHEVPPYLRATYGVVTFFAYAFLNIGLPFFFPNYFRLSTWTVQHEIVLTGINFIVIGFLNLLNSAFFFGFKLTFWSVITSEVYTFAVGIFPVFAVVVFRELSLRKQFVTRSNSINSELVQRFHSESYEGTENHLFEWEEVKLPFDQLLFFQSSGNYVDLYFADGTHVSKIVLRMTLKSIESLLPTTFVRCHKSFIVNLQAVERTSGNAQGLKLHIFNTELRVPVSRQSIEIVKTNLVKVSN